MFFGCPGNLKIAFTQFWTFWKKTEITKMSNEQKLIFGSKFILGQNSFFIKTHLDPNSFRSKLILDQNSFWIKTPLDQNSFWIKIYFGSKLLWTKTHFGSKLILDQNSFWIKTHFGSKMTPNHIVQWKHELKFVQPE